MFMKKFRNIFLFLGNKKCVRNNVACVYKPGNIQDNNVSATAFPGSRLRSVKGRVAWGFGIISKAPKWINRNRNCKMMV